MGPQPFENPTIPAEHTGESAIPESSATGDNYFADRPRLKDRPLTGEGLPTVRCRLSEHRRGGEGQTQPTPRNRAIRPDHQERREEGMEVASPDRGNVA